MYLKKILTQQEALQKIKTFCAYQERCHQEVKNKLYSFGIYKSQVEELISQLIAENYLNEERFAIQFAGGKFRMKHWGKKKIEYELKKKNISPYCIRLALRQIDDDDYLQCLEKLAIGKWQTLKGQHYLQKQAKLQAYLLQKGFETELIRRQIQALTST